MEQQFIGKISLDQKIKIIGTPVPQKSHIVWNKQNTFSEYELIAYKSDKGAILYGMVKAQAYRWFVWTEIYGVDDKIRYQGREFELHDIAKLPKNVKVSLDDVGLPLDTLQSEAVIWGLDLNYQKNEIVAVRDHGKIKYGCIAKLVPNDLWSIAYDTDYECGTILVESFKTEDIGKFTNIN